MVEVFRLLCCFLFLGIANGKFCTSECKNKYEISNPDNKSPNTELIFLTQDSPPSYSSDRIININRDSEIILVLISNNYNSFFYELEDYTWKVNLKKGSVKSIYTNTQRERIKFGSGWSSPQPEIIVNSDWFVDDGSFWTKHSQEIVDEVEKQTNEDYFSYIFCDSCEVFDVVNDHHMCKNQKLALTLSLVFGFLFFICCCFFCFCVCTCFICCCIASQVKSIKKSSNQRRKKIEKENKVENTAFPTRSLFTPPYPSITPGPPLSDDRDCHSYNSTDYTGQNIYTPATPLTPPQRSNSLWGGQNISPLGRGVLYPSPGTSGKEGSMLITSGNSHLQNLAKTQEDESHLKRAMGNNSIGDDGPMGYGKMIENEEEDSDDPDSGQFSPYNIQQFGSQVEENHSSFGME